MGQGWERVSETKHDTSRHVNNIFMESAKARIFRLVGGHNCVYSNVLYIELIGYWLRVPNKHSSKDNFIPIFMKYTCKDNEFIKSGHVTSNKKYL